MEMFKSIKNYDGYEISNLGRVRKGNKILAPTDNGNGYLIIGLHKNNKRTNCYIHRLVATHFIREPKDNEVVNHKDFNTKNNNINNLEWVTQKENINYSKEKMKHRKNVGYSSTGEQYIYYRKSTDRYRVIIDKKELGSFKTLNEAIMKRDELLG